MINWTSQDWIESDASITWERAANEIRKHGNDPLDYLRETFGNASPIEYVKAADILLWLGY